MIFFVFCVCVCVCVCVCMFVQINLTICLQNHWSDVNAVFSDGFGYDWCVFLDSVTVTTGAAAENICLCNSMLPSIPIL